MTYSIVFYDPLSVVHYFPLFITARILITLFEVCAVRYYTIYNEIAYRMPLFKFTTPEGEFSQNVSLQLNPTNDLIVLKIANYLQTFKSAFVHSLSLCFLWKKKPLREEKGMTEKTNHFYFNFKKVKRKFMSEWHKNVHLTMIYLIIWWIIGLHVILRKKLYSSSFITCEKM